ncbi:MAG: folylpolyglutamate synthase/dihydrofolate synthase family protein [Ruthenibacterium sp.]
MNYEESVAWVHALPRLAARPGIENTRTLLQKLGEPQKRLKFVHVAGTNGKGSVTVMLAGVLRAAGYKTGANISPYVLDFRERFLINGEMIAPDALAGILTEVRAAANGQENLVEFDAVTAAALLWFAREACDIVCLETGLGGRLDSTNAVENTLVACITSIGMDHTELLGDTYSKIAAEKCGIFKNHCTVVCYPAQKQEALDEITLCAEKRHCPLIVPETQDLRVYRAPAFENRINYGGYDLTVPFPGLHQAYNAMMVVEAALALCEGENGFDISDDAIMQGIAAARFPARIELLSREPLVILDGAHNPDGARALADTLRAAGVKELVAVMGVLEGKQPEQMLTALCPYFTAIYTVTPASPRAISAEALASLAHRYCAHVTPCDSVTQAVKQAKMTAAQAGSGLVICGSLYLAAQARKLFQS